MDSLTQCRFTPIAYIQTDFPAKFGIPRQSGLVDSLEARIVFTKEYRRAEAFRGLEDFSHIWLIWLFSEAADKEWSPTVRPPRLGGNKRMGVFATRSPYRPNPIGLSAVRLIRIDLEAADGPVLYVSGADLMDGTPILDIKPYLPFADCRADAKGGFADSVKGNNLIVDIPDGMLSLIEESKREALTDILKEDPRPSYIDDPERVYGFVYAGWEIKFTVNENVLTVRSVTKA